MMSIRKTINSKIIDSRTISDFGKQWTRYPNNLGWYSSKDCLEDIFGPLFSLKELENKYIADIGSGTGRIVQMLLDSGARKVIAIEPSDAFFVMENNLSESINKIELVHDGGEALNNYNNLDIVISLGVLHHIFNPGPIINSAFNSLKPGGKIIVWLYGKEGNRLYLLIFGTLRYLTKYIPDWLLSMLCSVLNVFLVPYIWLCKFFPLPMKDYMLNHLAKLDYRMRKVTIFDQLNPTFAEYYSESEARSLIKDSGFVNINLYHRHKYSWTVIGEKPNT